MGSFTTPVVNATHIQVAETGTTRVVDFYGSFTNGTTGTITSFTHSENGTQLFSITGTFDWATVSNYATAGDWWGMNNYFLAGNDTLKGSSGNDWLDGSGGNDILNGNGGDDFLMGGSGNDKMNGGTGWDQVDYTSATAGVTVNLGLTTAQAIGGGMGTDTLTGIEGVLGSAYADNLTGTATDNWLWGGTGGNDILMGGAGDDILTGGAGNDTLNGGTGYDSAEYLEATAGVKVNLALTGAQAVGGGQGSDTLVSIEDVWSSGAYNDILKGNAASNVLGGGGGNDKLYGYGGNDVLVGGAGNDILNGGAGYDAAIYLDVSAGVTVNLSLTSAQNTQGAGTDTLVGIEALYGSDFNDTLRGRSTDNGLTAQQNQLVGFGGNDRIIGGAGAEKIIGDYAAATDFLITRNDLPFSTTGGKDTMTGGGGADIFDFNLATDSAPGTKRDVITDFVRGTDLIDLSDIDAVAGTAGVNDSFSYITGTSFSAAGQLRFANGILYGNTDADATAEFQIALTGITTMAASDFVL